jgi:plastocyanin
MPLPRVLLVVPGLLAGLCIPALTASPKAAPTGTIGMTNSDYAQTVVTIQKGERLTFVNDSHVVHVIGPGKAGHILSPEAGVPITGFHLMPTNSVYTSPPWETTGTFWMTCSVHTTMTMKVIVTS